jgi:hypothetical protein
MSTVAWSSLNEWITKNPFTVTLKAYHGQEQALPRDDIPSDDWSKRIITPATPLSAVLMMQDDIYQASPVTARHALLRDETTAMQENAALQLKGRAWPVRRTAEGLAAVGLEEERHSLWTPLGFRALCFLRECQIIVVHELLKTVSFYPEDIRLWAKDIPVYIMDSSAHTVSIPPEGYNLLQWFLKQEGLGLAVNWPETEGTMDELRAAAEKFGETTKAVKAVLQKKVGRAQSVAVLKAW